MPCKIQLVTLGSVIGLCITEALFGYKTIIQLPCSLLCHPSLQSYLNLPTLSKKVASERSPVENRKPLTRLATESPSGNWSQTELRSSNNGSRVAEGWRTSAPPIIGILWNGTQLQSNPPQYRISLVFADGYRLKITISELQFQLLSQACEITRTPYGSY